MNRKIFTVFMGAGSKSRARSYTMKLPDRIQQIIDVLPDGTSIIWSVEDLKGLLSENGNTIGAVGAPMEVKPPDFNWTWREKLWIVPAETRIGTSELAEAFCRPASWVYSHTEGKAENPIPHRKLDGTLMFTVGEVRTWLRESEEVLVAGPMESTQPEIRGLMAI